jgi:hypothetical protein
LFFRCRDGVRGKETFAKTGPAEKPAREVEAVALAAGRFGRRSGEVRIVQKAVEESGIERARGGDGTVAVEGRGAAGQQCHQTVDDHVAGTGVEGADVGEGAAGRERGDVADAPDVLDGAVARRVAKDDPVEVGDERRGLAAGSDVGDPEIGDDGNARALRDRRGFADLEGRGPGEGPGGIRSRLVPDGLTVGTDDVEFGRCDAGPAADLECRVGEELAEQAVQGTETGDGARHIVGIEGEELGPDRRWVRG